MAQLRIGIGGIAIESSTFNPRHNSLDDFGIVRGQEMLSRYPFMPDWTFEGRTDIDWLPCMHARSIPGGSVVRAAYETMKQELLDTIQSVMPLDGFFLNIHGAMNVEDMDDAEGDLATAIRQLVGPECVISASMDLHGNVTPKLVSNVDIFTAHRLAPHEDGMLTIERAVRNLLYCIDNNVRPMRAWCRIPVILPGERTSTLVEPGKTVYAKLTESDVVPGVMDASLWVGYVWADEPRSNASVVVSGTDADAIKGEAIKIAKRYWDARDEFKFVVPAGPADWCIEQALKYDGDRVVISDSGDNPTAGGAGDMSYFLERLLAIPKFANGELSAIYAAIPDPTAVEACYAAGVGGEVSVELGGKLDPVHGEPLAVTGTVQKLYPNDSVGGNLAVLRVGGVSVILASRRKPYHTIDEFTKLDLDPMAQKVVAVKIGYLEPELREIAKVAFLALTPGGVNQDIPSLPYKRVIRPIYPLDTEFEPTFEPSLFGVK